MKYESEKNRRIRECQRSIKDKLDSEEQYFVDNLKNNTRVVTTSEAEASGIRMYNDAKKKQDLKRMKIVLNEKEI